MPLFRLTVPELILLWDCTFSDCEVVEETSYQARLAFGLTQNSSCTFYICSFCWVNFAKYLVGQPKASQRCSQRIEMFYFKTHLNEHFLCSHLTFCFFISINMAIVFPSGFSRYESFTQRLDYICDK